MQRLAYHIIALVAGMSLAGGAGGQTPVAESTPAPPTGAATFHATHPAVRHPHRRPGRRRAGAPPPRNEAAPRAAGLQPAPVPDENKVPPAADNPVTTGAAVDPGELQMHYPPLGEGFLPGSSHTVVDNTTTPKVPGVIVRVPVGGTTAPSAPP